MIHAKLEPWLKVSITMVYVSVIRWNHLDITSFIVESCKFDVPLPSHLYLTLFTSIAFDNFDHEEATLSGIGGSHYTASVLYQNNPNIIRTKPNISDTSISHWSKIFTSE